MNELKKFNYLQKLGQGAFGYVFKVFESNAFHAVKLIEPANEGKDGICESAVRELTLLNRLRHHPMIVNYESVDITSNGTTRIVFPFMSCDLFTWLERSARYDEKSARSAERSARSAENRFNMMKLVAYRMLILLRDMDELGILHRDIKPQNILMDEKDVPYLCDFGSGREYFGNQSPFIQKDKNRPPHLLTFYELHTTDMITYLYRPPEIKLSSNYTTKVDVYALGCTLIQVLTGRALKLNRVPDPSEWADHLMNYVEHSSIKIDVIWIRLLKSMICANPYTRISAKSALQLAFYEQLTRENIVFKPPSIDHKGPVTVHPLTEKILYGVLDKTGKSLDGRVIKAFVSFLAHRIHVVYTRCCETHPLALNSKLILLLSCMDLVLKLMDQYSPAKKDLIESTTPHTEDIILISDLVYGERYVMYMLNYYLI